MADKPKSKSLEADTIRLDQGANCGAFYLIRNYDETGRICRIEIHAGKLKSGACGVVHLATIADLINSKLEHGANIQHLAEKYLVGRLCREDMSHILNGNKSCIDAIGKALLTDRECHEPEEAPEGSPAI